MSNYKLSKEDKLIKEKLQKYLSYTSQDYESILSDMIDLMQSGELNTEWDNLSEADPIFILMHLLAAHKDILNYMLDYRILETYMSTARERASLIRIANSVGYKIPGLVPARSKYKVTSGASSQIELLTGQNFTSGGESWAYVGDSKNIKNNDEIELVQGIAETVEFEGNKINRNSLSLTLPGSDIAVYRNTPYNTSKLVTTVNNNWKWQEVDNLVGHSIAENPKPYIIDKDTAGMYYIKFPADTLVLLGDLSNETFKLTYVSTLGRSVGSEPTKLTGAVDTVEVTLDKISNNFMRGYDELTADEVREGYKNYRGTLQSLSTLEDYKQFILTKQKSIPNISKVMAIDIQGSTNKNIEVIGNEIAIPLGTVHIYLVQEDMTKPDTAELKAEMNKYKQAGITLEFNNGADSVSIDVSFTSSGNTAADTTITQLISDYIYDSDFGDTLKASEIKHIILTSQFNQYYIGKDLSVIVSGGATKKLLYNEYAIVGNITTL